MGDLRAEPSEYNIAACSAVSAKQKNQKKNQTTSKLE